MGFIKIFTETRAPGIGTGVTAYASVRVSGM